MTAKSEELYKAVLESISAKIPQFKPLASMSDLEPAAWNAIKEVYPQITIHGLVSLHIMYLEENTEARTQHAFKSNIRIQTFVRQLMAIPFLPASLINPFIVAFNYLLR